MYFWFVFQDFEEKKKVNKGILETFQYISNVSKEEILKKRRIFWETRI